MSPRKDVRTAVTTLSGLALAVAAIVSVTSAAGESPATAATAPPVVAAAPVVSLAVAPAPSAAATERPAEVSRSSTRTPAPRKAKRTAAPAAKKAAAQPTPRPARVIRIAGTATSADMQQKLDACNGPIQVNWATHATEIAQHNYCGGAWFDKVSTGQLITVEGGSIAGTYVVNGNRRYVGKGASASSLDGLGSLVLQTCVGSRMVLVGLSPA